MLPGPNRLRQGRDIDRVYRQGRYGSGQHLTVKVLQRSGGSSRAVVVVGKKVSKKAVIRNSLRRRLSEILAHDWQRIEPGCDIVVTVTRDTSDQKPAELAQDLHQALTKVKAIK